MFHFGPETLWNMNEQDLNYWLERAEEAREIFNGKA
jgi:hypothetical protein